MMAKSTPLTGISNEEAEEVHGHGVVAVVSVVVVEFLASHSSAIQMALTAWHEITMVMTTQHRRHRACVFDVAREHTS